MQRLFAVGTVGHRAMVLSHSRLSATRFQTGSGLAAPRAARHQIQPWPPLAARRLSSSSKVTGSGVAAAASEEAKAAAVDSTPPLQFRWNSPRVLAITTGVGLCSGFCGALVGVAGGVFMIPALSLILRLPHLRSIGTSICANVATSAMGSATYFASGLASIPVAVLLTLGSSVASRSVVRWASRLGDSFVKQAFAVVLMLLAPVILFMEEVRGGLNQLRQLGSVGDAEQPPPQPLTEEEQLQERAAKQERLMHWSTLSPGEIVHFLSLGVASGATSAVVGIGGGLVSVSWMNFAFPEFSQQMMVGTAMLSFVVPNLIQAGTHGSLGNIVLPLVPGLALGSMIGSYLGSRAAIHMDTENLRRVFGVFLFLSGASMLLRR